jgi:Type IV leader peptidase family./Archaeal Peptidase A24 C-terminus Type II.
MDLGVVVTSRGHLLDLVRLFVVVPVFVWAAYRDVQTRRIPGRVWRPLVVLGVVLLALETWTAVGGDAVARSQFLLRAGLSLGFVVPLAYLFWRIAGFGGADAKAVMVLALLFPTYPEYLTTAWPQSLGVPGSLPVVDTAVGVFPFTALTNAVVVGAAYPLGLIVYNAVRGDYTSIMFLGRPVAVDRIPETYGRLLERADGSTGRGLDLDALRMYLQWRGAELAAVRAHPERFRDPDSLPSDPNAPGDGAITDGGVPGEAGEADDPGDRNEGDGESYDDPWGATAFLEDIDRSAYGTSATELRDGLDLLVESDRVWVSPGLPFMVPLALGTVVGLTYGDLLFGVLGAAGVV